MLSSLASPFVGLMQSGSSARKFLASRSCLENNNGNNTIEVIMQLLKDFVLASKVYFVSY